MRLGRGSAFAKMQLYRGGCDLGNSCCIPCTMNDALGGPPLLKIMFANYFSFGTMKSVTPAENFFLLIAPLFFFFSPIMFNTWKHWGIQYLLRNLLFASGFSSFVKIKLRALNYDCSFYDTNACLRLH